MKFIYALLTAILFLTTNTYGSGFTIHGKVADNTGKPVEDGLVLLYKQTDSSLVSYTVISRSSFDFKELKHGSYFIKVSCIGYEDQFQTILLISNSNVEVLLKQKINKLNEVQIVGSRKAFSYKEGNIKVNVENSVFSSIPNTVELLAKLPAIQVSPDRESISVIGRGTPLIYIDNQKMTMDDLNSLSVNDIKTIEIIENPSAKYEAEGRALILITRKKNIKDGIKMDFSETVALKRYVHNRSEWNSSFKKKKLELKTNVQYNYLNLWESTGNDFSIAGKNIESNNIATAIGPRTQYICGGGIYYQINEDDYFSLGANGRIQKEPFVADNSAYLKQENVETNTISKTLNVSQRPYFNTNFNYNKKLNTINGQLFVGGQYSAYTRELTTIIYNKFDTAQSAHTQDREQYYHIDVWTGRVDFEKNFKNAVKWELGVNMTDAKANSISNTQNYSPPYKAESDYTYAEKDYAAYTQLSGRVKKISCSAGLRIENMQIQGGFSNNVALLIDENDTRLFPRAKVSIPLDSSKTITFSYARNIVRPNYANANQISNYINPFFEWANNINLRPSTIEEASANFQYKENSLNLSFYTQKDPVFYIAEYDENANKLRMINRNLERLSGINLRLTLPVEYKLWSASNMMGAVLNEIKDPIAVFDKSSPFYYIYSSNQFKLPGGYTFMITGWYSTKRYQGVFENNAMYAVDTSFSKIFYKKLTCTLSFNDIFRSLNFEEKINTNNITTSRVAYDDAREVSIAVKYAFGGFKDSKFKNKEVNENGNRLN